MKGKGYTQSNGGTVTNIKLISYDIIADPGFVSARFTATLDSKGEYRKRKIKDILNGKENI